MDFNFNKPVDFSDIIFGQKQEVESQVEETQPVVVENVEPSFVSFEDLMKSIEDQGETKVNAEADVVTTPIESKDTVEEAGEKESDEDASSIETDVTSLDTYAPDFANSLADMGFINELPEGVKADNFTFEDFKATIQHNLQKREEKVYNDGAKAYHDTISRKVPPLVLNLLDMSLNRANVTDEELYEYIDGLNYSTQVAELNPVDPIDAQIIIREKMRLEQYSEEVIKETIEEYEKLGTLENQAKRIKPILDAHLAKVQADKDRESQQIIEQDKKVKEDLRLRLDNLLSTGQLGGIQLSQDEVRFLYNATLMDDVKIPVKGGKQVEVGYSEALTYAMKYDPKGNLENFLLSQLVLKFGPTAIEKYFAKKARTEETVKFIQQHKMSNAKKSGNTVVERKASASPTKVNIGSQLFSK